MLTIYRLILAALPVLCVQTALAEELSELQKQVFAREEAFAQTMADRDFEGFKRFIAEDAIFFNGPQALRGREQVVSAWSGLYEGEQAPFSWGPDQVEVLASGDLALSTGPVLNLTGQCLGRFNSIWRRSAGIWLVVFDKGSDECPSTAPAAESEDVPVD